MHHIESAFLRWVVAISGLLASIVLLTASGVMNFAYGCSMATNATNCTIYGSAAAAADVLMALSPFFIFAAWRNREWVQAFAATILWVITTAFAVQSALGHAALNRLDTVGHRQGAVTNYKDLHTDLTQARKELGWNPEGRGADIVVAEIERHKQHQFWTRSSECANATLKDSREYCQQYQTLQAELASAKARVKLKSRIEDLQSKIRAVEAKDGTAATTSEADPQAKTVARLTGLELDTAQGALIAIAALMILVGAGLGPYASVSVLQSKREKHSRGSLPPPMPDQNTSQKLALPSPPEPPPIKLRADPSPEWAEILAKINLPTRKERVGDLRLKDRREVLAWRFYSWLLANGEAGEHPSDKIDDLYAEFATADHRNPWGMRIVKFELRELGKRCIDTKLPRTGVDGSERLTMWTIHPMTPPKLLALLEKNKVVEAAPAQPEPAPEPEKKSVIALFGNGFGARGSSLN